MAHESDNSRAIMVEFTSTELIVALADGRRIATPLDWYPAARARVRGRAGELRDLAPRHPLAGHRRGPERRRHAEGTARGRAEGAGLSRGRWRLSGAGVIPRPIAIPERRTPFGTLR